jgi:hypothetical protein
MKSFLQGKKPSTVPALAPSAAASRQALPSFASPPSGHCADGGTQIEVVKEGDKVARLVITCGCGERIEIECLYPAS